MRANYARNVFTLAARIGCTVTVLEAMSEREVSGWLAHFNSADQARVAAAANDGAIDIAALDRRALRAMFHR
jgi:hypothetical protein